VRKKERKKKKKKRLRETHRNREREDLSNQVLTLFETTKWVVRKTKAKEKKKTMKDWGSVVSFKYCGVKKKTHTQAAGREGGREVSHRRNFGKLALSICLS
jgi:hypothetical protein